MEDSPLPPLEIPQDKLSSDALAGIIESFILREGTDYGWSERSLESKIQDIEKQLERGDVKIIFDRNTESVTMMTTRDFIKLQQPQD